MTKGMSKVMGTWFFSGKEVLQVEGCFKEDIFLWRQYVLNKQGLFLIVPLAQDEGFLEGSDFYLVDMLGSAFGTRQGRHYFDILSLWPNLFYGSLRKFLCLVPSWLFFGSMKPNINK